MKACYWIVFLLLLSGCATTSQPKLDLATPLPDQSTSATADVLGPEPPADLPPHPAKPYRLSLAKKDILRTGIGVKAVVISKDQKRVYSINLEDLSVIEFDREQQLMTRKLRFVANKGWGFNYSTKRKIRSIQEKPVEAHLTHDDRFLWVSLHNAGGIIIWDLKNGGTAVPDQPFKSAYLYDYQNLNKQTGKPTKTNLDLLWIKTGKTPKVITSTSDDHWLYVANWHAHSVSVIDISQPDPATWLITKTIKPFVIPRGMVVTPDDKWLLVAQMGSRYLSKVAIPDHTIKSHFPIGVNPRHLVYADSYLYVSLNKGAKLLKVDLEQDTIIHQRSTVRSPRTIALSKDNRFIFVVGYHANKLQVFKTDDLSLVTTIKTWHHPVAVDIVQTDDTIQAWVGNYSSGTIDVFTFDKIIIEDEVHSPSAQPSRSIE